MCIIDDSTNEPVELFVVSQMLPWNWFKEETEKWEGALPFITSPMPMTSPTMIGSRRDLSMTSSSGNARLGMSGTTNTPSHVPSEPASEVQAEPASEVQAEPASGTTNIPESQQHDDA